MAPKPIVELLVAAGTAERSEHLVGALRSWCDPRAPDAGLPQPTARFATSCRAPGLADALAQRRCPVGVWLDADREAGPWRDASVLVTDDPDVAAAGADAGVLLVPRDPVDCDHHRWLPPALRSEWRARFGLPDLLVIGFGVPGAQALPADAVGTALALASAAAVSGRAAVLALALGTPMVTDADTANWIGAVDGEHVVVAPAASALDAATDLADGEHRCASLSHAARRLAESRHDIAAAARTVAQRLGVAGRESAPHDRLRHRLTELDGGADSGPAVRALAIAGTLPERGAS